MELEPSLLAVLPRLPVFPLPNTVLFPGVVLPLHIFEERYKRLVADALESHGYLGIAMVRPEHQEGVSRPSLYDVGTVGKIIHADPLPSGKYNILVQGCQRVRLIEELPHDRMYRQFHTELVPQPTDGAIYEARAELARLQSCVLSLSAAVADTDAQLVEVIHSTSDPVALIDILAAVLVSKPYEQQALLATGDLRVRLVHLIDTLADAMLRVGQVPQAAQMN